MSDHQPPTTAPGFTGLPLTPPGDHDPAPRRRGPRQRIAAALAVLALAGAGGAVATAGLGGSAGTADDSGVDSVTPPAGPVQPGVGSTERDRRGGDDHGESGENDQDDEA